MTDDEILLLYEEVIKNDSFEMCSCIQWCNSTDGDSEHGF